ncbi:hypothetical protein IEO21_04571 [Rhodonia placenta]|uniref:Uncharacterized protein n=1 Tax=Rhodonia placenta TaxID=104341 RepID=A0A8H7P3G9_9APHY|nr:hypothetical protein IEO21_04571 [Postia placenta]
MRFSSLTSLIFLAVPVTVFACEGECIVAITNVFLGNYTAPISAVMDSLAQQISHFMPSNSSPEITRAYLSPLIEAYNKQAYDSMERAIFPQFFHGKCQQNGVDPPGCPNPDCPVVCGTPGSMVHYYSTLREIAFNRTRDSLVALSAPDSPTYASIERAVMEAAQRDSHKLTGKPGYRTAPVSAPHNDTVPQSMSTSSGYGKVLVPILVKRQSLDVQTDLRAVMGQTGNMLLNACSGIDDNVESLSRCSWEKPMKDYILTFP